MGKISINIATGSLQKEELIVGIDLGTTNSLIAVIHPDTKQPTVLKEFDNTALVPSIVHFSRSGQISVGTESKPYLVTDPEHTLFSVKRLMGKSYNDIASLAHLYSYKIVDDGSESLVKVNVDGKFYTPVELSSFILKALKQRAEHILKTPVNRAVITVPAYFNDTQRQATRDAGKLAGLDVLRIINEPTAASLAYGIGLKNDEEKTIVVYDLGGGTFDISILRISNGIFEVLATNGDTYLGGDDFDRAIFDFWVREDKAKNTEPSENFTQQLRLLAEEAKKHLSTEARFESTLNGIQFEIEKAQFEQLVQPLIDRTIGYCESALKDSGIALSQIDEVLMVGGSSRMPLIKHAIGQFFKKQVNDSLNPDEVVALGAAIQADILAGNNKDLLLLDVTPLSLGIETMGGLMDVLIPRNTKIPTKVGRQYTTQKDGQSGMRISVYQGERDMVKDNRKLAEFNFTGIPGMPAGMPKVEVSFLINADGILVVKAKELRSGVAQSIEVKPQYGLTDEEVEKMLHASLLFAKGDMQQRALVEAKTEALMLIETTTSFMQKNQGFLTAEEEQKTKQAIMRMQTVLEGTDKDAIQLAITTLNEISSPYAERLMDKAIGEALKGKKV